MTKTSNSDILNLEEAAELLGVSIKTFNKVLHAENLPARKIGREWRFSRAALIAWVGSGGSADFYRESSAVAMPAKGGTPARRAGGWQIELD